MSYQFTNQWFEINALAVWNDLIPHEKPSKILEIGSYEGAASSYLIEKLGNIQPLEIYCIDTWEGGEEHDGEDMAKIENRFDHNISYAITLVEEKIDLIKCKEYSDSALVKLLADGHAGTFDFIYVDGSHQAPDVICDAILGFKLLKIGGVMVFDDYIWKGSSNITHLPKPAIDAFTTLFWHKIEMLRAGIAQIYVKKISL